MQSKLKTSSGNNQAQALVNFPRHTDFTFRQLSSRGIHTLARMYDDAVKRNDQGAQLLILMEVDAREPLFDFSYLEHFINAYLQVS